MARAPAAATQTKAARISAAVMPDVVTNGFVKKTQKTPKTEIDKAKAYRKGLSFSYPPDKSAEVKK